MLEKAVGFYWSLPVPWAGFTRLSPDIEVAVMQSRTIAYQRCLVQQYASQNGLALIREIAFLELEPDRGSHHVGEALQKAAKVCAEHAAELLYVDFTALAGWRSHHAMQDWLLANDMGLAIEAAPVVIDGERFDPAAHFTDWRDRQSAWMAAKHERVAAARMRALALQAEGQKKPAIARLLNAEGLRSATGKPWTADSLRKIMLVE